MLRQHNSSLVCASAIAERGYGWVTARQKAIARIPQRVDESGQYRHDRCSERNLVGHGIHKAPATSGAAIAPRFENVEKIATDWPRRAPAASP